MNITKCPCLAIIIDGDGATDLIGCVVEVKKFFGSFGGAINLWDCKVNRDWIAADGVRCKATELALCPDSHLRMISGLDDPESDKNDALIIEEITA